MNFILQHLSVTGDRSHIHKHCLYTGSLQDCEDSVEYSHMASFSIVKEHKKNVDPCHRMHFCAPNMTKLLLPQTHCGSSL